MEDPIKRQRRLEKKAAAIRGNRIAIGVVITLLAIWGWITLFSHRGRLLPAAMMVYLLAMTLPAVQTDQSPMFGWKAAVMGLLTLHPSGTPANFLFIGTYFATLTRRKLLTEPRWNLLFSSIAALNVVLMLSCLVVLAISSGGLALAAWGTPFESPQWPGQWTLFGSRPAVFSVGYVVWIAAGVMLLLGVRRLREDAAEKPAEPNEADDEMEGESPFATVPVPQKAARSRARSAAAWSGAILAVATVAMALFCYVVHSSIYGNSTVIRRHGMLDDWSQFAFIISFLTAFPGLAFCLQGLPRKLALVAAGMILLTLTSYLVVTPFRVYFP